MLKGSYWIIWKALPINLKEVNFWAMYINTHTHTHTHTRDIFFTRGREVQKEVGYILPIQPRKKELTQNYYGHIAWREDIKKVLRVI